MPSNITQNLLDRFDQSYSVLQGLSFIDQRRMTKRFYLLKKRLSNDEVSNKQLDQWLEGIDRQLAGIEMKRQSIPEVDFPHSLPVSEKREDIALAIRENQVVIVAGETGSGKTTQIPKICLSLGLSIQGQIGHTQPRRIAARTVASRIAEELKVELGGLVGYQVRFTDHADKSTAIKLMTDGILLAEIQRDPLLLKYSVIIIDEAHERSLNIDFLLGYLKQLLTRRPELKVIVTSATIDVERFSEHFSKAPIIQVSGRTFPVDVRYRPWHDEAEDMSTAIVGTLEEILTEKRVDHNDVLVFLSGEREIREVSLAIKRAALPHLEVLPLYARLNLADQNRIFQPHRGQRVILATNVAETSITVPGIRYVIDTGVARISRYSLKTKVQRLPVEAISQASANQRKGRCGRVANGICYRLYSEEDFVSRPEFTDPELLRTNLAAVVLQMLHLNMGKVEDFPFVDAPDKRLITDGYKLLEELNAVNSKGQMTEIGKKLYQFSVDPRFARMLIDASEQSCLHEVLLIVSALTIQDPRERPEDKKQAADEQHRRFQDENSDFMAYINLWDYCELQRQELTQNQFRKLCKKEYLNYLRLKEWRELHHQLKLQIKSAGLSLNKNPASFDQIHQSLLVGLLSNVGYKNEEEGARNYLGTRTRKFTIFPGSGLRKKKYAWILVADFIETSQLFAHCIAKINPEWIIQKGEHLLKRNYFEPYYDVRSGSVKAFVKITLWGLTLAEKQRVNYAQVDPVQSREIFIRTAFVEGKYKGKGGFYKTNEKLIKHIAELEAKARRRDILVDDEVIYEFYAELIPDKIVNLAGFERWRKQQEISSPSLLLLSKDQLMLKSAEDLSEAQFPNQLKNSELVFHVKYVFEPTNTNDGMNVTVPVDLLHLLDGQALQWLVPGLLREKCIALLKTLPKLIRKHLVPVPNFVDRALARMKVGDGSLVVSLGRELERLANVSISESDWQLDKLETFFLANIVVVDANNKIIDQGRNVEGLRKQYKAHVKTALQHVSSDIERDNISYWDFDTLPESVELTRGSVKVRAYPALVLEKNKRSVCVQVLDNPVEARVTRMRGLCLLAANEMRQTTKYLRKELLKGRDLGLTVVELGTRDEVIDELILTAVKQVCFKSTMPEGSINKKEFERAIEQGKFDLVEMASSYEALLVESLALVLKIKKMIKSSKNALALALAYSDIQYQLDHLFYKGFLFESPRSWLKYLPRYLEAIIVRLEKAPQKPQLDRVSTQTLSDLWQVHEIRLNKLGQHAYLCQPSWQEYRWLLEELRVSLFAQTLKTSVPVSEKRLKKLWVNVGKNI